VAPQKSKWTMSESDVVDGFSASSMGPIAGGGVPKSSRKSSTRSLTMELVHLPTGISVTGTVPPGHYTRCEMVDERERLRARLWVQLENEVAKALRIPGS
jgi:hypothetical protein